MFGFFKTEARSGPGVDASSTQFLSTLHGDSDTGAVVMLLWDEILGMHGIPATWVGCEVSMDSAIPAAHLVQLVVWHWDSQMVLHAPALQHKLLTGLGRSLPQAALSGLTVVWRFEPSCGCPMTELPQTFVAEGAAQTDGITDHRGNIRL